MAIFTVTEENFEAEVLRSKTPVLVDFYADWCAPCKMIAPYIDEIAAENDIKVGKVNIDEQKRIAAMFKVRSIPTLAVVADEKIKAYAVGFRSKEEILDMLK